MSGGNAVNVAVTSPASNFAAGMSMSALQVMRPAGPDTTLPKSPSSDTVADGATGAPFVANATVTIAGPSASE